MKVVLFNESFPPLIDGVSIVVQNYCKELKKSGDTPIAVVPTMKNQKDDFDFKVMRFGAHDLNLNLGYPVGNPINPKLIFDIVKESPDILHSHSPFIASMIARQVRQYKKIPYIITYHTRFEREFDTHITSKAVRMAAEKFLTGSLNGADEIWGVSEGCKDSLNKIGYNGNFYVARNGTDFKCGVASADKISAMRKKYNLSPDEDIFIYVGRVEWYKNLKLSFNALKRFKSGGRKFKFLIIGNGVEKAEIEEYCELSGLKNEVIFTGPIYDREDLRTLYSLADLLVFPSTFDTAGLVVMEAAACNCPSVLIKGSCAAETAQHKKNAILCEENIVSLSDSLSYAVADKNRLKEIGKNACRDLYLSFEDAVKIAKNRYEYLVEKISD